MKWKFKNGDCVTVIPFSDLLRDRADRYRTVHYHGILKTEIDNVAGKELFVSARTSFGNLPAYKLTDSCENGEMLAYLWVEDMLMPYDQETEKPFTVKDDTDLLDLLYGESPCE